MMRPNELPDLPQHPPQIPSLDLASYRLEVAGAVDKTLSLSVADLRAMPQITVTADFHCLEGWVVRDRSWHGVPLAAVLEQAGLHADARYLAVYAVDHGGAYNVVLDREQALAPMALLALARQGQPLTHIHGAPVRLQVPGADCFVQVKWVSRLVALREPVPARGREIALGRLQRGWG